MRTEKTVNQMISSLFFCCMRLYMVGEGEFFFKFFITGKVVSVWRLGGVVER
jgi:hypothetical protein